MKLLFENWRQYLNEIESITPILDEDDIEKIITGPEFSFNSLKTSKHRWGTRRPKIDYYFDEQRNNWKYIAYILNNPDKPDLESTGNETLEDFLGRVRDFPRQLRLKLGESLYFGTSTTFQEEIAKNGIKAPSEWGNYGLAEENAMKIVEEHGGEPMVIQMPYSEFKISFLLDEDSESSIIHTEDFFINIEKQEKTLM
tara:strand:+ start:666 stop:1259 length:594 start_codon:yes stop_codon:yes gene_type:complete